jgi:hypothetical protein
MRALYVCASILMFALLAVVVLGMTVSQCRPSMFVPDNPYSAKTERNWITSCANVFSSYGRNRDGRTGSITLSKD